MDVRQLKYFEAVFMHRNLSHAAKDCNVVQSAISTHINNLEYELGTELFLRHSRGMEPTEAAVRLHNHAKAILRHINAATEDLQQLSDETMGSIDIGLPFTVLEAIGMSLITEVRNRFPKASVIIHEGLSSELYRLLEGGDLDFIFAYNAPDHTSLVSNFVHEESIYCVGSKELLGDTTDEIPFSEVEKMPHILLRHGASARSIVTQHRLLERLFETCTLQINSVSGIRKALLAGIGTNISPVVTFRDLVENGQLVARKVSEPYLKRNLYILRHAERVPTKLMENTMQLTVDLIEKEITEGRWP